MHDVWLSINGLLNHDPTLFDDVYFPCEDDIPKEIIVDKICMECGELPLVYTDPDVMKKMIYVWAYTNWNAFNRMWIALTEEYNPIHNYDRTEEWGDDGTAVSGVMGYNSTKFTDATKVKTDNTRTGHAFGNIGVTTSAQMIDQEIDIRSRLTFAQIVAESFKAQFCVMVY